MLRVRRQPVKQQKDEAASGDAVTDSGTFPQKPETPNAIAAAKGRVQEGRVVPNEVGLGEEVDSTWGSVTPEKNFIS